MSETELIGKSASPAVVIDPILFPSCFLAIGAPVPVTIISFSSEAENCMKKLTDASPEPTVTGPETEV